MASASPTKAREDFSINSGAVEISKKGQQVLSGFASLISATIPTIRPLVDTDDAEPDSAVKQDAKAAANIAIQFCISCSFECANSHYGTDQASLFVDALSYRFFNRLPNDELFQRYLELPLLPNQLTAPMTSGKRSPQSNLPVLAGYLWMPVPLRDGWAP